jgi:hypothetical protein
MKSAMRLVAVIVVAMLATGVVALAGVKVRADFDKEYDFTKPKTFGWHPDGAGEVKMLQLSGDDPVKLLERFDPVFKDAIATELAKRGLVLATDGKPDIVIHYYVLIGPNSDSQFRGQFVGAVPPWGLPDFAMTTTSFKVYEQGTVVLDLMDAKRKEIVWRGVAEAEINRQKSPAERDTRIRAGIADLLKKFPPKAKK